MRRLWYLAAGAVMAGAVASCGSSGAPPVAVPPTTAYTDPSSATVPALGHPSQVMPATAADAGANATGACGQFSVLYVRLAVSNVPQGTAVGALQQVAAFADAAATGAPGQWAQLRNDVANLLGVARSPAWAASARQLNLPAVKAVYDDCRPLQ